MYLCPLEPLQLGWHHLKYLVGVAHFRYLSRGGTTEVLCISEVYKKLCLQKVSVSPCSVSVCCVYGVYMCVGLPIKTKHLIVRRGEQ